MAALGVERLVFLSPNHIVEPHGSILRQPEEGQLLYKIIRAPNFLDMLKHNYLYFRRVDTYRDDILDGEQLPLDRTGNEGAKFAKDKTFSVAKYYDTSRTRTYACCFSLNNSDYIWHEYGNSGKDAICLVIEFGKLRTILNRTIGQSALMCGNNVCHQIFSVNYGIVEYADKEALQLNAARLPNPIQYTYVKDKKYQDENELRVSLSAIGIGNFALNDAQIIKFPESLQMQFDFKKAFAEGIIKELLFANGCQQGFQDAMSQEMEKLGFLCKPPVLA